MSGVDVAVDVGTLSDTALVVAVIRGSEGAVAEAYRRHGDAVYDLACQLCEPAEAEEVTRRAFLALWHDPDAFAPAGASLRSCLVAEAHRQAVSVSRRGGRRRRHEVGPPTTARAGASGARSVLAVLPDHQRQAILAVYLEGRTYREAAGLLHRFHETVLTDIRDGLTGISAAGPGATTPASPAGPSR